MWQDVERGREQMTLRAGIPRLQTHSQYVITLLHYDSCCKNALQCYDYTYIACLLPLFRAAWLTSTENYGWTVKQAARLYLWNWRPISRKQGAVRGEQDTSNGNSFVSVEASLCSLGFWVSGLAVTNVSKLLCSFEIDLIVAVTMFIFRASRSSKSRLVFLLTHSLP